MSGGVRTQNNMVKTIILVINNTPQKTYRIVQYTDSWNQLYSLMVNSHKFMLGTCIASRWAGHPWGSCADAEGDAVGFDGSVYARVRLVEGVADFVGSAAHLHEVVRLWFLFESDFIWFHHLATCLSDPCRPPALGSTVTVMKLPKILAFSACMAWLWHIGDHHPEIEDMRVQKTTGSSRQIETAR